MMINVIGRGTLFTNQYGDSVYLINGNKRLYLCDTGEGQAGMEHVKNYIKDNGLDRKELVIFNSHSDWDHIWGNDLFPNSNIIGHIECKKRMEERGYYDLEIRNQSNIKIILPNITFTDRLTYEDDGIEYIYAPGHTRCSSICVDLEHDLAYVGDLLEEPVPYINSLGLDEFLATLEFIKKQNYKTLITTHSGIVNSNLIEKNMEYLTHFHNNDLNNQQHTANLKNYLLLTHEKLMRERLGSQFHFKTYKLDLWYFIKNQLNMENNDIWNLKAINIDTLRNILDLYAASHV